MLAPLKIYRASNGYNLTAIPRTTALDESLSYAARGLLLDILSRPDGWDANADELSQAARAARGDNVGEGRRAIRALFAELEAAGYMRRLKLRRNSGAFYTVLEVNDLPHRWGDQERELERTPFPVRGQASVVYAIGPEQSSVVKIGTTENIKNRLRGIQTGSPHRLYVRWQFGGSSALEEFLHARFDHLRLEGEWFDFGDEDPIQAITHATDTYYLVPLGTCASW